MPGVWNFRVQSCPWNTLAGTLVFCSSCLPVYPLSLSFQTPNPKSWNSTQSLDLTFSEHLLWAGHLACVISFHPMKCV